ncbi:MAG: hypothetical protein Q4P30_03645 [Eubacteriales bacterium]|nr:hypothetical protein [Eubacteriales bacterium]
MFRQSLRGIIRGPAYYLLSILPFVLTLFLSAGTQGYLDRFAETAVHVPGPVVRYSGPVLGAAEQFAVSELSFILMMVSVLTGLAVLRERHLHVWDRLPCRGRFFAVHLLTHVGYGLWVLGLNSVLYIIVFEIRFSVSQLAVFASILPLAVLFGGFTALCVRERSVLSNIVLMAVMLSGYLGGALSLTAVLQNTRFMNVLRYASPLTLVNEVIYRMHLHLLQGENLVAWAVTLMALSIILLIGCERRIRHGSII